MMAKSASAVGLLPDMRYFFLLTTFLIFAENSPAQVKHWVFFHEKPQATEWLQKPERFLSPRALERRQRQNIALDASDVPVDAHLIQQIKNTGAAVLHTSKWLNAVSVFATTAQLEQIKKLPDVREVTEVKSLETKHEAVGYTPFLQKTNSFKPLEYGQSGNQIFMVAGQFLHNEGSRGQGMLIAALDGGFNNVNNFSGFDSLWARGGIVATYNFVTNDTNVFVPGSHGMSVLSVMAAHVQGGLVGTAPYAQYLLLKTEDEGSETRIEEDNWVAGAEFADSAGADIISSSVGYNRFDSGIGNYTFDELDGRTAISTLGAVWATRKGILVINSAGNEGGNAWRNIIVPADADSILAVGAVNAQRQFVGFSSRGPTADDRIKPDVAAQGQSTVLLNSLGTVAQGNGTSFSAPIISGMAACLWQRHPNKTNMEIRQAILESASHFYDPNNEIGYGIPNFQVADYLLNFVAPVADTSFLIYPNPFTNKVYIRLKTENYPQQATLRITDYAGRTVSNQTIEIVGLFTEIEDWIDMAAGVYVFHIEINGETKQKKMVKISD